MAEVLEDVTALGAVVDARAWAVDADFDAKPLTALAARRQVSVARLAAGCHSLLVNGTGNTVVAAAARTLLESAITTLWQTANHDHPAAPLVTLSFERHHREGRPRPRSVGADHGP